MCLKARPGFEAKSISSLKKKPSSRSEQTDDYQRILYFLPNLRDFPISRYVGLGIGWTRTPKRDTFYYVSKVSLV